MDSNKNDEYFIQKIRTDLAFVVEHTRDIDQVELINIKTPMDCGLRNRIVHDSGNVDMMMVYSTLKEDIPGLLEMMDKTVEDNY